MTDIDIAAIRAQHANEGCDSLHYPCDAIALCDEVERLTAENAALRRVAEAAEAIEIEYWGSEGYRARLDERFIWPIANADMKLLLAALAAWHEVKA